MSPFDEAIAAMERRDAAERRRARLIAATVAVWLMAAGLCVLIAVKFWRFSHGG